MLVQNDPQEPLNQQPREQSDSYNAQLQALQENNQYALQSQQNGKFVERFDYPIIEPQPQQQLPIMMPQIDYPKQQKLFESEVMPVIFHCQVYIILFCNSNQISVIQYKPGNGTHFMAFLLCLLGLILIWIPYVSDSCKDVVHKCPACQKEVGRRSYLNM